MAFLAATAVGPNVACNTRRRDNLYVSSNFYLGVCLYYVLGVAAALPCPLLLYGEGARRLLHVG